MSEKVLIISPVPLFPTYAGNRKRIVSVCKILMEMGYRVDFFYSGFDENLNEEHEGFFNGEIVNHSIGKGDSLYDEVKIRLMELYNGMRLRVDNFKRGVLQGKESGKYNQSLFQFHSVRKQKKLRQHLNGLNGEYCAVIVNYAVQAFYLSMFGQNVLKIIDTHDKLTDRYRLFFERGDMSSNWYSLSYGDEKRALTADVIWAITDEEREFYEAMLDGSKTEIKTLGHIQKYELVQTRTGSEKTLLLTGSANSLNISGFEWFYHNVWKLIQKDSDKLRLIIAGSICNALGSFPDEDRIILHGLYEKEDELFSMADLCINPMQDGTGLKIKTVEALAFGKPMLTTSSGAAGLSAFIGKGIICSDEPLKWKSFIEELGQDDNRLLELKRNIEDRMSDYYHSNIAVIQNTLRGEN